MSRSAVAVLLCLPVGLRADDPPAAPAKPKPAAAPDWSGFVKFSEVTGTVVAADENGLTLRVVWYTDSSTPSGGSGVTAFRSLQGGRMPSPRSRTAPRLKENREDYELLFADAGLVRWNKLTLGPGAGGKFVSSAEQNRLKLPAGAPGWAAARTDLAEGQVVEVTLVRPKDVPLAKATPDDLRIKYAVILSVPAKSAVLEKDGKK